MATTSVIIRVELRGQPGGDIYKSLHNLMNGELGWGGTLMADDGTVMPLPSATYSGETDLQMLELSSKLKDLIVTKIWQHGARVLVVAWNSWGEATTSPW